MPLIITHHPAQRLRDRGLSMANVNWCVAASNYYVQPNGNRYYTRSYDAMTMGIAPCTS